MAVIAVCIFFEYYDGTEAAGSANEYSGVQIERPDISADIVNSKTDLHTRIMEHARAQNS